jgi:hypothetical protein
MQSRLAQRPTVGWHDNHTLASYLMP